MSRSVKFLSVGACLLVLWAGCNSNPTGTPDDKVFIVTTTNIIADCVRELVGEAANVASIMGPGVDPHSYKASQGDIELLLKADLIVYNGLHLEGKMSEVLRNVSGRKHTVRLSDGLDPTDIRAIDAGAGVYDPHFWFDVMLWKKGLRHFVKETTVTFPGLKDTLQSRSVTYYEKMAEADNAVRNAVLNISEGQRILITSHDAFSYFGAAYGIEVRGLQGISTLSEAGLRDVTSMVNYLVKQEVKAVFVESSVSRKSLMSVVEGCRRKGHDVEIGGELFSDALGTPGEQGGTYLGMIEYNTGLIVNALK